MKCGEERLINFVQQIKNVFKKIFILLFETTNCAKDIIFSQHRRESTAIVFCGAMASTEKMIYFSSVQHNLPIQTVEINTLSFLQTRFLFKVMMGRSH